MKYQRIQRKRKSAESRKHVDSTKIPNWVDRGTQFPKI